MKFCINCTSSAHFAPSLVQEQNGPKCTQTLRNATKHEFRVPRCVSGEFLEKSSDTTSWHELLHLLHQFSMFCTNFHALTKRSQTHPNTTNCTETLVYCPTGWIGRVRCKKIQTWHRGTNFYINCTSSPCFAPSFMQLRNDPKCTQILRNWSKH